MDAKKIKSALSLVHQYEKKEGRFAAVKRAIENLDLDKSERGVLFNAVNLPADEQKKLLNHRSQIGGTARGTKPRACAETDREVVATLVREGRKDLARQYLQSIGAKAKPVTAKPRAQVGDDAWDTIAGAWVKAQGQFVKVLQKNEQDALENLLVAKQAKKSIADIKGMLRKISDEIRKYTEEV